MRRTISVMTMAIAAVVAAATVAAAQETSPSNESPSSDHLSVVGRVGLGYFGFQRIPFARFEGTAQGVALDPADDLIAPTLGFRYWVNPSLGVEAGMALQFSSGQKEVAIDRTISDTNDPSTWGVGLHAGLPLALSYSRHYKFLVIPEVNFAVAGGSVNDKNLNPSMSGMLFEMGARAGAEVHFGFIGIPELSLQGTIGLHMRYASASIETTTDNPGDDDIVTKVSSHNLGLTTSIQDEPWDIFTGNISAIYYF
ncbi:MAG: hypothetical protein IPJ88_17950 [Myxococcales bacterium]|nr:MAG: hypothetical protein IPJ88_17950 [Myxococcales bacterium]